MILFQSKVRLAVLLVALASLASCGNTVRGFGRDAANMVDATGDAARDVAGSF